MDGVEGQRQEWGMPFPHGSFPQNPPAYDFGGIPPPQDHFLQGVESGREEGKEEELYEYLCVRKVGNKFLP